MSIGRRKFLELGGAAAAAAAAGCSAPPLVSRARTPVRSLPAFDGKVEHFIVLMMENRSYDQMLGSLPGAQYDGAPVDAWLPFEDHNGVADSVPIVHGAPPDRFSPDPGHNFKAVDAQIHGAGLDAPPDMKGFARRFLLDHPSVTRAKIQEYATIYGDGRLPVLQTLAKEYGVCTHWFCSMPSSTTPNRMFVHAGTSRGATRQGAFYSRVEDRMIFDKLDVQDWRVYFHDVPHLWLTGDAWTQSFCGQFHHMGSFESHVRSDSLPTYSFIEPQHVIPPWSSQHPSSGVSHGEKLIASVYNTLVSNPAVFEKSLLLIVYDEHGGFYDHVVPPGFAGWNKSYPGIEHEVVRPDDLVGDADGREQGYDFTTLGPRVPAVVISPWIEKGSVFGWKAPEEASRVTFDHTSILATVGCMTDAWVTSHRARAAQNLGVVINRATPRTSYLKQIVYRDADYLASASSDGDGVASENPCDGVAGELCEAFSATHGSATPEGVTAHYQTLLKR